METPTEHPGLIISLSPCRSEETLEAIKKAAILTEDLDRTIRQSNWGPVLIAISHHASALRHCWFLCSSGQGGSADQFPAAEKLAKLLAPAVICHKMEVEDANDLPHAVGRINLIYAEAPSYGLRPAQIIADLTGGTSVMSGAVVLSTVSEDRNLQYLRQDTKRLVFLRTGPHLVPGQEE